MNTYELMALSDIIDGRGIKKLIENKLDFKKIFDDISLLKILGKTKTHEKLYNFVVSQENYTGFDKNYLDKIKKSYDNYKNKGIEIIAYGTRKYPQKFANLSSAPIIIFAYGNTDLLEKTSVAIVGTRRASRLGIQRANKLAKEISDNDIALVSGLAQGIDLAAHRGVLESKNPCNNIAIIADIDKLTNTEQRATARKIIDNNGLIIWEKYPPFVGIRQKFVARNRLQVALSETVFIIETDKEGGTMHTANFANKQNKPIYCPNMDDFYIANPSYVAGIDDLINKNLAKRYSKYDLEILIDNIKEN